METFLYIVFFLSCIVLIITVLLQPGKTDAGALFTSGVSSASMNPRGTASVLSKLTIFTATVFMLSALLLSLPVLTGNRSVLETQGPSNAPTAPVSTTNTNTVDSNSINTSNTSSNSTEVNSSVNTEINNNSTN
ncbi:MAG: preprotein translocase subunit SecG [Aridibacter sp.]